MPKKTIKILLACFVFGTAFMITLYAATYKVVHEQNSFLRIYPKDAPRESGRLDIEFNSYYIAGITDDHIYLGNITAPYNLLVTNHALTDTQHVTLRIKDHSKIYLKSTVTIDAPYFFIADGLLPGIFRGKIGEWEAERFMYDSAYFNRFIPISPSSFAIRAKSSATLENALGKIQRNTPHVKLEHGLLVKHVDGIFCTDGRLLYNDELKKLVYTYFYRNGYVVYDTNLNLDYRGHTIDTFTRSQVKVGFTKSDSTSTLTYKKFINKDSYTYGNHLFINSNLVAKNDSPNLFRMMSVVDVYDLRRDAYKFSFNVVNFDGKTKMRDFAIFKNRMLIALFDHYMIRYELEPRYL